MTTATATLTHVHPAPNARERSEWSQRLAAAIKGQREAHGMSVRGLAQAAGMDMSVYYRIERAERVPDVTQVAQIAAALGMRGSELLRMAEGD